MLIPLLEYIEIYILSFSNFLAWHNCLPEILSPRYPELGIFFFLLAPLPPKLTFPLLPFSLFVFPLLQALGFLTLN